jgi:hypothetical protein
MEAVDVFVEMSKTDRWGRWSEASFLYVHHDQHANLLYSYLSWSHLDDIVPKYDGDITVLRWLHVVVYPS